MKRRLFILTLLCIFSICAIYSYTVSANLSENLIRLHIVANSNSDFDQKIKLMVRNEIIAGTKSVPTPEFAEKTARHILEKSGIDYGARAEFSQSFVPEKRYKNIRLPQGNYTCLKVILGEGKGENWWCIAYPPLCFCEDVFGEMSDSSLALLENRLSHESFCAIVDNGDVNLKFWVVEKFQELRKYLDNL